LKKFTFSAKETMLTRMLLHLLFDDWMLSHSKMNASVHTAHVRGKHRDVRELTAEKFLVGFALFIGAAGFYDKGEALWTSVKSKSEDIFPSIVPHPHFGQYMKDYYFKNDTSTYPVFRLMKRRRKVTHGGSLQQLWIYS